MAVILITPSSEHNHQPRSKVQFVCEKKLTPMRPSQCISMPATLGLLAQGASGLVAWRREDEA
jgi:hypothetical protein